MKRQSVLIGAIILAIGGIFAKVIGALYKIPLTNVLGTNGMGLYYLVFPLYSLLLVLVSSGIGLAVTRLVSSERAHNNHYNQVKLFKVAIIYVTGLSVLLGIILTLFSNKLALLQGNINAGVSYIAISPAIMFAGVIAVIRGYFQGQQNMIPTLLNNVLEQIVKFVAGLILATYAMRYGVSYAVMGAILGVTLSEFCSLVFIMINYIFYKRKYIYKITTATSVNFTFKDATKKLLSYAYPATLSAVVFPIATFIDSFLIINILTSAGFSSLQATNLYGISNGIVNTLVSLPVLVCTSLATAIVPNLSGLHSQNNFEEVKFKTSFFIKISWIIAIAGFVGYVIFSAEIIDILYRRGLSDLVINEYEFAYKLLMISSVTIIYYAFLQTFTSVLQSINKPIIPFVSLCCALTVRILLVYVLVSLPGINIFGVVISNIVFLTIACFINLFYLKKYVKVRFGFTKFIAVPIFAGVVAGATMYICKNLLSSINVILYTIISGLVGLVIYAMLIYCMQAFTKQERKMFASKNILNKKIVE